MRWTLCVLSLLFSVTSGHDEKSSACPHSSFTCKNGACVEFSKICNGYEDCTDGSDENNCETKETGQCPKDYFGCDEQGTNCIPMAWVCDQHKDCQNGKDEDDCHFSSKCPEGYMKCGNGHCIVNKLVCNGVSDCEDNSDEEHCGSPTSSTRTPLTSSLGPVPSSASTFSTRASSTTARSISASTTSRTASTRSSRTSPDFTSSTTTPSLVSKCSHSSFTCKSGECVEMSKICDGHYDCTDWSDEENCEAKKIGQCPKEYFGCDEQGTNCIPMAWVCDRHNDCQNGKDEDNCHFSTKCPQGYMKCRNGHCIPNTLMCNGVKDCEDGADEDHCVWPTSFRITSRSSSTTSTSSTRVSSTTRTSTAAKTSGSTRSTTSSDFTSSVTTTSLEPKCSHSFFTCKNGKCVEFSKICNGHDDCADGSDEANCEIQAHDCQGDYFSCYKGTNCIPMIFVCDGHKDCSNGEDEDNCHMFFKCPDGYSSCRNRHCVANKLVCNGVDECGDGTDEEHCPTISDSSPIGKFHGFLLAFFVIVLLLSFAYATIYVIRRNDVKHLFGQLWNPVVTFRRRLRRLSSQHDLLIRHEEGVNPKLEKAESFSNPVYEGVHMPVPAAYMSFKTQCKDSDNDSGLEFNTSRGSSN